MSLAFRAFFALPPEMATSDGVVTNAVHGFVSMLALLVREQRPSGVAVAFDLPGAHLPRRGRRGLQGRPRRDAAGARAPDRDHHRASSARSAIPVVTKEGYEADDVLATLATRARDEDATVIVVTGDRDCFQLVEDPYVRVLYNRRGVSDYSLYDEAGIFERTGVEAARYPLLAALRGDPSDNLPGVPGVGEKTAAKLFAQFRDLDELFAGLDDLTPKLRENLAAHEALARRNAEVMTLVRDLDPRRRPCRPPARRLGPRARAAPPSRPSSCTTTGRGSRRSSTRGCSARAREGEAGDSRAASPSSRPSRRSTMPPRSSRGAGSPSRRRRSTRPSRATRIERLVVADRAERARGHGRRRRRAPTPAPALADAVELVGHDVKELWRAALGRGVDLGVPADDTSIAAYLLDSSSGRYRLDEVLLDATGDRRPRGRARRRTRRRSSTTPTSTTPCSASARRRSPRSSTRSRRGSPTRVQHALYDDMELPLLRVLARMEDRGIRVDAEVLRGIAEELRAEAASLEVAIHEAVGHEFRINSTQQLQIVLYDELGLTKGRKTKTGFSTDAATLEALRDEHEVVDLLLRYREVEKLRSTYGENLAAEVRDDGRIHATVPPDRRAHRAAAAPSSRTSTTSRRAPRTAGASAAPSCPSDGWQLLVADYDQIELRVIAHLSGDDGLLRGVRARTTDVHRFIAGGRLRHRRPTRSPTTSASAPRPSRYGLAYGMEAFGLARRFGTSVGEAKAFMDQYFDAFPGVRTYMDDDRRPGAEGRLHDDAVRPGPPAPRARRGHRRRTRRGRAPGDERRHPGDRGGHLQARPRAPRRRARRRAASPARIVLQVHDEVLVEAPPTSATR